MADFYEHDFFYIRFFCSFKELWHFFFFCHYYFENYVCKNASYTEKGFDFWQSACSPSQDPKETNSFALVFSHSNLAKTWGKWGGLNITQRLVEQKKSWSFMQSSRKKRLNALKKKHIVFPLTHFCHCSLQIKFKTFFSARRKHLVVCLFPLKGVFTFMWCCAL